MGKTSPFLLTIKYNLHSVSNARIDLTVLHNSRAVEKYRPSELVLISQKLLVLLGKRTL